MNRSKIRRTPRRLSVLLLVVLLFCTGTEKALALVQSDNPLIDPQEHTVIDTAQRHINILLMGIDYGYPNYTTSGYKTELLECHTDAMLLLTVNMITKQVDMISLPRDTFTSVPDVRGVYKLNAAFNCADSLEQGLSRAVDAASRLLGGIRIDYYCAFDLNAVIALGDYIGGVDFDVDMYYQGNSGHYYAKGLQHLDGTGIMDYARARKNAQIGNTDLDRTNRQRRIATALIEKMCEDVSDVRKIWNYATDGELNFFTNLKLGVVVKVADYIARHNGEIGNYVLSGTLQTEMTWNFVFTDEENRAEVLRTVYGIEAEPLRYSSLRYAQWLYEEGMNWAKIMLYARELFLDMNGAEDLTEAQSEALRALEAAYNEAVPAFDEAARALQSEAINAARSKQNNLRKAYYAATEVLGVKPGFRSVAPGWEGEKYPNEYHPNWN